MDILVAQFVKSPYLIINNSKSFQIMNFKKRKCPKNIRMLKLKFFVMIAYKRVQFLIIFQGANAKNANPTTQLEQKKKNNMNQYNF